MDAQVKTTDSVFVRNSRAINFVVNKINVSAADRRWIKEQLVPQLTALGENGLVLGRAAASPEGPYGNNRRLANERRASVSTLLRHYGVSPSRIRYDVVPEDHALLHTMMQLKNDPWLPVVDSLATHYEGRLAQLKEAMKRHEGGKLWRYVLKEYFPQLRAVRIMVVDKRSVGLPDSLPFALPASPLLPPSSLLRPDSAPPSFPVTVAPAAIPSGTALRFAPSDPAGQLRREWLSVKTNLLFDLAYMPGYDRFCPIPNVAVEYYPLRGHFTYGASFDGPWWQHYNAHKYFQLRNYQLHARYFLRSGDIRRRPPSEGPAFSGLYFSLYAHAYLYNICFDEKRGWEGEGWGAGIGAGYVMPLGRSNRWKLEMGVQAGYLHTLYDPYQWKCPVDPDSDKEQYYYKWYGEAKDFRKRQHSFSFLGPTRLEITLSYNLLFRKNHGKGISFKRREP